MNGRAVLQYRVVVKKDQETGSVVALTRAAGENIDVRAGGALIGYAEIVVTESAAAVRITDFKAEE